MLCKNCGEQIGYSDIKCSVCGWKEGDPITPKSGDRTFEESSKRMESIAGEGAIGFLMFLAWTDLILSILSGIYICGAYGFTYSPNVGREFNAQGFGVGVGVIIQG